MGRLLCRLWPLSESTALYKGRGDFRGPEPAAIGSINARAAHTSSAVFALPGAAIILRGEQLHNWIKAAVHELPSRAG